MAKKSAEGRSPMCALLGLAPGKRCSLEDKRADATSGMRDAQDAQDAFDKARERLRELQYQLFVDGRFGLLVVLQAIDGGGKDSTIRHVISAFNPQGCTVTSFKVPSEEERKHDFLWRIHKAVPARGEVGVFNRSHYEDVLVVRVDNLVPKTVWSARYEQINAFERGLHANGIRVVKFFLHISKGEQKKRFEDRLREPHKLWKFDPADLDKRRQWKAYRAAFEDAISNCNTEHAPWYVIPANRKWYRNYAVARILVETLEELPLEWPKAKVDAAKVVIPD
jgi:PPK2 family polyphosphate:nucleotide phosphotransferase